MSDQITRLFDFSHYQLKNKPQEKCFNFKENNIWQSISTKKYLDDANRVSTSLLSLNVKPNDKIAVITENNNANWHTLDIGVLQIGAQNIPLYATLSEKDYEYILNHSDAKYCFVSNDEIYQKVKSVASKTQLKNIFSLEESTTEYSIERAIELLEDGGWKQNSEGQFMKSVAGENTPLSFKLAVPNIKEVQKVANVVVRNLSELGIWVDIETYEEADLNNEIIRTRNYDALLFGYVLEKPSDTFAFWHSSQQNDPGLNISMYNDPKADASLINIRTQSEREDDIETFLSIWSEDMPAIFLYAPSYLFIGPEHFTLPQEITHTSERFNTVNQWYQRTRHVWNFLIRSIYF